jgi:hypothetical protein
MEFAYINKLKNPNKTQNKKELSMTKITRRGNWRTQKESTEAAIR